MDGHYGCTMGVYLIPINYILKNCYMLNIMLYAFYLNKKKFKSLPQHTPSKKGEGNGEVTNLLRQSYCSVAEG